MFPHDANQLETERKNPRINALPGSPRVHLAMRKPTSTRGGAQHYCALAPHIRTWTLAGRLVELLGDSPGAYSVADLAELLDTDVRAVQRKLAQLRADGVLIERLQWDGRTPLATYRAIKGGAR